MTGEKCSYPGCGKPATNYLLKREIVWPVCGMYHLTILSNDQFDVKRWLGKPRLAGPFKEIELLEAVMAAREVTKLAQPATIEDIRDIKRRRKVKEPINSFSEEKKPKVMRT